MRKNNQIKVTTVLTQPKTPVVSSDEEVLLSPIEAKIVGE